MSEGKVYPKLTKEQILALPKNTAIRPRTGRSTVYSHELSEKICEGISSGLSLASVCKQPGFPTPSAVYLWIAEDKDFFDRYQKAQLARAEHMFDGLVDLVDEAPPEEAAKTRLRVDTRKWVIARMNPRKFGEKVEVDHTGEVSVTQITRKIVDPTTIEQNLKEIEDDTR